MYRKRSIAQRLVDRQVGLVNSRLSVSQHGLLENVQNLRPIYELRHCAADASDSELHEDPTTLAEKYKNHVSSIRFNRRGNLVGSSYWCNDKIELWDWILPEDERDMSIETGHGCAVARFDWLPVDNERLIVTVDRFGHLRLLDLGAQMSCSLYDGHSCGIAYDLHPKFPFGILVADHFGLVRNLDLRAGNEKVDIILHAKVNRSTVQPYDIEWIGVNPQRYHEFCIAGGMDEFRIYDRRSTKDVLQKLYINSVPQAKIYKMSEFQDPTNLLVSRAGRACLLDLAYNYNGTRIAAALAHDTVFLYDTTMSYPIGRYDTQPPSIPNASIVVKTVEFFGPKSEFVIATARNRERRRSGKSSDDLNRQTGIYIWDTDTQRSLRRIPMKERSWALAVHPHVPILASSLDHRGIQLWG